MRVMAMDITNIPSKEGVSDSISAGHLGTKWVFLPADEEADWSARVEVSLDGKSWFTATHALKPGEHTPIHEAAIWLRLRVSNFVSGTPVAKLAGYIS